MNKVLDNIIEQYARKTGISPSALSQQVWQSVLEERMRHTRISNLWDYYEKWLNSPAEAQLFFDRIVVLETWFFRDQAAFNYLTSFAFNEWYPKNHNEMMRLLSVPCSTGEEPYSMAISLIHAGFPARMFSIDAVDISPTAIAKAELGIYGKNSFRGKELPDFSHFFEPIEEGYKIKSKLHEQVNFRIGNVFDYTFLSSKAKYDVIFCRNLLIYLHPEAQHVLLGILSNLLSPRGVLFVGATEGELVRKFGLTQAPAPKASAFYNTLTHSKMPPPPKHIEPDKNIEVHDLAKEALNLFQKAKEFADKGESDEALSECLTVLQNNGPSAEGYYLLGVLMHSANRKDRAEEFFKKALYLNPELNEALAYMILLAEANHHYEEAQLFRERLARMERLKGAGK